MPLNQAAFENGPAGGASRPMGLFWSLGLRCCQFLGVRKLCGGVPPSWQEDLLLRSGDPAPGFSPAMVFDFVDDATAKLEKPRSGPVSPVLLQGSTRQAENFDCLTRNEILEGNILWNAHERVLCYPPKLADWQRTFCALRFRYGARSGIFSLERNGSQLGDAEVQREDAAS